MRTVLRVFAVLLALGGVGWFFQGIGVLARRRPTPPSG